MKKKIFLFIAAMISLNLMARDATVKYDDICYQVQYVNTGSGMEYWATVINSDYDFTEIVSTYDGDVVLPEKVPYSTYECTVTDIAKYAFNESNITSIELPSKLERIMYHAFYGCSQLTSITCRRSEDLYHVGVYPLFQTWNEGTASYDDIPASDVFEGVDPNIPVYVPADVVTAYQNSPWGDYFTNILPITPTALDQITNDQSPMTNKIIKDNQLFILRGEKVYTIDGRVVH